MDTAVALPPSQTFSSNWAKWRIQISRFLGILRKRWWIPLITVCLGVCIAAWVVSRMPPAYLSLGRLMVSGQIRINEGAAYSEELVNFFGTQVELMQSDEVRKRAQARVQALHPEMQVEKVNLQVGQVPRASIFVMRAVGESPSYTQAYLDACMDEYINTKKEMRAQKSESTTTAIADELVRLEKEMQTGEDDMHNFQKQNNIGFLHEEGNSAGVYLAQLNRQLADLKTEYELLNLLDLDQNLERGQQNTAASNGEKQEAGFTAFGPLADYQRAKQQLQLLKADREDLSRYLRPKHPSIVVLDDQISKYQKLLDTFRSQSVEALKTRRESIHLQIQNLEGVIKEWEVKALDLSRRIAEYDKIKAKNDRTKSEYDRLLTSMRSVDVTKNVDQDTVSILERATPALSIKPGLAKIMWEGFGAGVFIGLLILFVMDKLDDRISSFIEFRSHFPQHILGQIPKEQLAGATQLLKPSDPRHALLESFRTLRSSIIFLPVEGARPKTLMVTSGTPGEGKTTVASNLSITLAFSGARTLLIDADLRRGRLHDLFNISNDGGFSKVLQQRLPWREAIHESAIHNLWVLPRGKTLAHPAEHFLSKSTDQFLQEIYSEFDYIVFDSAPVMVADDSLSLGPKIDGTIFVIRFNTSSARISRKAIELLTHRQANLLGLVCNDVKISEAEYGYGYYYAAADSGLKEAETSA